MFCISLKEYFDRKTAVFFVKKVKVKTSFRCKHDAKTEKTLTICDCNYRCYFLFYIARNFQDPAFHASFRRSEDAAPAFILS
jgi:hypothetical protein